ncbi:MAG: tRNA threonylcarbamoyladenosine dehydratase [Ruminococcus sp.]|nr:tRNA threonylcarbamoyladenosine dehydratase [Ruminococcus sp.]
MREEFVRTGMLFGEKAMEKLAASRVAVFGIGGVGGHVAEALARSGVGALDLIDNDRVAPSNLNRQIFAVQSTIGMLKVDAAEQRLHDINPECSVVKHAAFFMPDTADGFDFTQYSYVVDAIDTVTGKIEIIMRAAAAGVPVISSMGAGNKIDPTAFEVADIYSTSVCPLARVMRRELKKRGVESLKVVYSKEEALTPISGLCDDSGSRRSTPGSNAFVPSVAGLIIAGEVIRDITGFSR